MPPCIYRKKKFMITNFSFSLFVRDYSVTRGLRRLNEVFEMRNSE